MSSRADPPGTEAPSRADARLAFLDALRVMALGLLIAYPVGMDHMTWDWHLKSGLAAGGGRAGDRAAAKLLAGGRADGLATRIFAVYALHQTLVILLAVAMSRPSTRSRQLPHRSRCGEAAVPIGTN